MAHRADRSRICTGHPTATGPVTPTCSWDRWGRAETERTALGEALVLRRRTRVRFPPPPPTHPAVLPESLRSLSRKQAGENLQLNHVGPGRRTGPYVRPWRSRALGGASARLATHGCAGHFRSRSRSVPGHPFGLA